MIKPSGADERSFRSWRGFVLLVMWLLLASCSGSPAVARDGAKVEQGRQEKVDLSVTNPWILELQLSGGIAGRNELLRLSDDGRALILDRRLNRSREIKLDSAQQSKISEMVEALEKTIAGDDVDRFSSSQCRDCLVYILVLPTADKSRRIRIVSDRLAGSPYRELIFALRGLMK